MQTASSALPIIAVALLMGGLGLGIICNTVLEAREAMQRGDLSKP